MKLKHTNGQWSMNTTKKYIDGQGLAITNDMGGEWELKDLLYPEK